MADVTLRDLRNYGEDVIDRVIKGERVIVTRGRKPVAELRPLMEARLSAEALVERWRHLPYVDPQRVREDIDSVSYATPSASRSRVKYSRGSAPSGVPRT
jgi:antitoxin (DNA-binding transcriptional repressor) of toxin-antitoxin stability system